MLAVHCVAPVNVPCFIDLMSYFASPTAAPSSIARLCLRGDANIKRHCDAPLIYGRFFYAEVLLLDKRTRILDGFCGASCPWSRDHVLSRLERVWGPGDGRPVEELKVAIDQVS